MENKQRTWRNDDRKNSERGTTLNLLHFNTCYILFQNVAVKLTTT